MEGHSLSGEARRGVVSRVLIQLTTKATHFLDSLEQGLSACLKSSSPHKPLTSWTGEDSGHQQGPNPAHHRSHSPAGQVRTGIISRVQIQLTTEATHWLDRLGQGSSACSKSSSQKSVTGWTGEDWGHQESQNPAHHKSNLLPGEARTGVVSRVEIQLTTEATHSLESQGEASSAGSKSISPPKPLTSW